MHRLRTLTFLMMLVSSRAAHAAQPELSLQATSVASSGSSSAFASAPALSEQSSTIGVKADVLSGKIRVGIEHLHLVRDYNSIFITRRNGDTVSLADRFNGRESSAGASAEFYHGDIQARLNVASSLGETPFPLLSGSAFVSRQFAEAGRTLFFEASNASQKRPEDYFSHPDTFATTARPQLIEIRDYRAGVEQIFGEASKLRFTLDARQRPQDRPSAFGASLRGAYSPATRWYSIVSARVLRELRSEPLLDERGYFGLSSADASVHFEPIYDLTIGVGYGVAIEDESARGRLPEQNLGTDSYLISLSYVRRSFQADLSFREQNSNTGLNQQQIAGGLKWAL